PPEQPDDIFTQMAQLFIDTYNELECAINILKMRRGDYVEARQKHVDGYQMRYLEIIKEYQEQLFAQPVQEEGQEQPDISPEAEIIMQNVDPSVRNSWEEEIINPSPPRTKDDGGPAIIL